MGDDATACPICGLQMNVQGDVVRAFGQRSQSAVAFGEEIVSLECGHRMHRQCLVQWLNSTMNPTCPMCRHVTEWKPNLQEEARISRMMETSWKVLNTKEKNVVKLTWIVAGCVAITDPIGFFFVSVLIMMITPPLLYSEMATSLARLKQFVVGKQGPGIRIVFAAGIASIITILTLANHEALELT